MSKVITDHSINSILGLELEQPRKRQRRNRTIFSESTIVLLEKTFAENKYPDIKERVQLAKQIDEEEARVQVWFQNRRARQRRSKRRSGASSDGISSTSSSPSPPPANPLKTKWLQIKEQYSTFNQCADTSSSSSQELSYQQEDIFDVVSPSLRNTVASLPPAISPLPKTPGSQQTAQRTQFSIWTPLTSSPPPTATRHVLRLPLTNQELSSSMSDFSQSEVRSADGKMFFNYTTSA